MKQLLPLSAMLLLIGCADLYKAAYPYEYQKQQEEVLRRQAEESIKNCEDQYNSMGQFDPIRQEISYFDPQGASFHQLSDRSKPSKKAKAALEQLDEFTQHCLREYMSYYKTYTSKWRVQIEETYQLKQRQLLLQLWDGEITYGQYNKDRIVLLQKRNQAIEEVLEKRRNSPDDLLLLQAVGGARPPQSTPNTQQRPLNTPGTAVNPIQTNCTSMGGTVNCQTYSY